MTEALGSKELEGARSKQPYELRREFTALRKLRKAEEDAKSRQSQAESNNIAVIQELNPNEADGTLVKDELATQTDIARLTDEFAKSKLGPKEKTPREIWNDLTNDPESLENPKLARFRSLDVTPDPSWFESILSKAESILEKTADGGQLKGSDKDSAIERRNDILKILMQGALELGSYIFDSSEISGKLAAQHDVQNQDRHEAVTSVEPASDGHTDGNTIIASTPCENCSDALAPHQVVELMEKPTQKSRDRSIWFEYHSKEPQSVYYTIDLYERVHRFNLDKYNANSNEKTVARLYVPIKSPPPTRRPLNFVASKLQIFNAISGWAPVTLTARCSNPFIPNKTWTEKVQELCQVTGYHLEPCEYVDCGNPGRYNACHAEKQIIAYWLYHYVLSSRSADPSAPWDKKYNEPIKPEYYEGLFIVISNPLCDCCDRFLNHVATYYKISFTIHCPGGPGEGIKFPSMPLELRRDDLK
ncbi:uncharacterized protein EAF02_006165 [Botrytis sinoallii]|uniref:uncharacterized protein n=1 Tax=Botrytis sinoallii TaxID=1463999 RepID=UPI001901538B|nr:uncharacterized protein EAF02_006165 [Botrytis sinoallii]KAF7882802.1 hypothetical protein EAF02_006165 [Botrytis sinoallii]